MAVSVLIVDDLEFMRSIIRGILRENGFVVAAEAENGKEAVEAYRHLKPDVVLLDITMPVMDGLAALKRIKRINPHSIVIMCSALGDQKMIVRAIQLGANDFVVKPFREKRIVSAITKAVGHDD